VTHLQFLPLAVRVGAGASEATASPDAIGAFLCRVFDRWIAADVGRVVIQTFDEALRPIHGVEHALCIHRETCGNVAVLERDGSFYACDHFVDAAHRIGNLRERDLADLTTDPRMRAFGEAKRSSLPRACRECDVVAFCNGGCRRTGSRPRRRGARPELPVPGVPPLLPPRGARADEPLRPHEGWASPARVQAQARRPVAEPRCRKPDREVCGPAGQCAEGLDFGWSAGVPSPGVCQPPRGL